MRILVLNGSPRIQGNTAFFCETFRQEATRCGHEVTVLPLAKMTIAPCVGCEACHRGTERVCVQRDDMARVLYLAQRADMLLLASPIYFYGLTPQMQTTLSRFYPLLRLPVEKCGLFLTAYREGAQDCAEAQYRKMVEQYGMADQGVLRFTGKGQKTEANRERIRCYAEAL